MNYKAALVLLAVFLTNLLIWEELNHPEQPTEGGYPVRSVSFNPYQRDEDPFGQHYPSPEDIENDLRVLAPKTKAVRIYTSQGGMEPVAEMAKRYGLQVIASAWVDNNTENNHKEVEALIKMAGFNKNVSRVIIGNETQLHKLLPREELVSYLREARRRLKTPVSTAEPWDFWLNNPEFAKEVDYIAIHVLPYWVYVPVDSAVDYVLGKYRSVKTAFPGKKVIIAETGWPSAGPMRGGAEPSVENQAKFIREFITRANAINADYNIIEAFDQPWKNITEGHVGSHWGIMDANRHEKFPIRGPVQENPYWRLWAVSASYVGFISIMFFFLSRPQLRLRGCLFSAVIMQSLATAWVELAREAAGEYFMPSDIMFWTVMLASQALLAIIFLTDAIEIADVVGRNPLRRRFLPLAPSALQHCPMVSIHVPCCKEPPEMVIVTLESLAQLEYPNFEVIVVDNNTADERLWRPVERRCEELGARFRFYSLGAWPGYKAGALNFALERTHPDAKIVGVVDADYVIDPNWLGATVPYFSDDSVGVVQAPQEHRGWEGNLFQRMENDEYSGFFRIGMVQRNEDNAIIQHGTMTLVSRQTLEDVGGWAEWCITEDAELGLRILNQGKKSVYLDHAFGHGLVPATLEAYKKQRFRWAYGGMRIIRRYWRELFGFEGNLTFKQRYQFVKGWLPWIGDGLHMLFTVLGVLWSIKLCLDPRFTEFPAAVFIYPAMALVVLRLAGTFFTYHERVRIGNRRTFFAMIAGGALTHVIAKAVVQGLLFAGAPFYRTPKMERGLPVFRNIIAAWEELVLALLLYACAALVIWTYSAANHDAVLWSVALVTQTIPYICSLALAVISGLSRTKMGHSVSTPHKTAEPVTSIVPSVIKPASQ